MLENSLKAVRFESISVGCEFIYNEVLYIKVENFHNTNAISIYTGEHHHIDDNAIIYISALD